MYSCLSFAFRLVVSDRHDQTERGVVARIHGYDFKCYIGFMYFTVTAILSVTCLCLGSVCCSVHLELCLEWFVGP